MADVRERGGCDWMAGVVALDGRDALLAVSHDLSSVITSIRSTYETNLVRNAECSG